MGSEETQAVTEAERVARSYFDRVSARDPDGMMEHWEPGGIGHIHGIVELRAPDSYRAWFQNLFAAFPDMRFEVEEIVADDTRAAVRWRARATFDGTTPFEGIEPTGAEVEMKGLDLITIRDGKLVSNHAYTNSMDLARQIGALPPQGSRAESAMNGLFNLKTRATRRLKRP
jgi:predicted ester cyclase